MLIISKKYFGDATFKFSYHFLFSNINNITRSNRELVLETINLLTVEQLLLYFTHKLTYTSINYKFYSYSVIFNYKYIQMSKIIQNRDLFVSEFHW